MNIVGRWDVTVAGRHGEYASWFEIDQDDETLSGRFVGIQGSARPLEDISFQDDKLYFHLPPQYEKHRGDLVFKGKVLQGAIVGETNDEDGNWVKFNAVPAPELKYLSNLTWGASIKLIRSDFSNWLLRNPEEPNGWKITKGILSNTPPSVDLVTIERYTDFKLHADFRIPEGGNSGIYLRGRYEIQIVDDGQRELGPFSSGSIYGFVTPTTRATKPIGEWNTLGVTLIGRYVTIDLNGQRICEKQEIPGLTGGALDSCEGEPGPIMLQGDHQAVEYRNLVLSQAE